MTNRKRTIAASILAATGLASLSPVQQAGLGLAAGAALWADPALAGKLKGKIIVPGDKGSIIRSKADGGAIIAPSDDNGEVRLIGLEPGDYTVQVFGGREETPMRVEANGELAFIAYEDIKRADPKAADPRARRALPVVRRWAEQIAFRDAAAPPPPPAAAAGPWCPPGILCEWSKTDLNTASAQQIADRTGTSLQSAVHIMVQREKGGRYTSIEDFARRNCPAVAISMSRGGMQIENVTVLFAGSQTKGAAAGSELPGFQCGPGGGAQFSLYGQKHNYVGHVTLLR